MSTLWVPLLVALYLLLIVLFAGAVAARKRAGEALPTGPALDSLLELRTLWAEHVFWARARVISVVNDLPSKNADFERLNRNQADLAAFIGAALSDAAAESDFKLLWDEHIRLGDEFVKAVIMNESELVAEIKGKWKKNAEELARFLSDARPEVWEYGTVLKMFEKHLDLTSEEAISYLDTDYTRSVQLFDQVYAQAMDMADLFAKGL